MSARSYFQRLDRPARGTFASPLAERLRLASRALVDPVFDNERPIWDRVSPLLLLTVISTLPLVAVTSGVGSIFGIWLVITYLLAGYLRINLAVERANHSHEWRAYVVAGGGLGIVSQLLPSSAGAVLAAAIGLSAIGAVIAGIRLHTPARSTIWYLLALSLALAVAGQLGAVIWTFRDATVPAVAGLSSLAGVALLMVALWLLLHRRARGSSRVVLLDTSIVAVGLTMLAWVLSIAPRVADPTPTADQAVMLGWPLVGLAALVVCVRFLLTRWPDANAARQFAGAALVLLIAAITASSLAGGGTADPAGHPGLSALWLLALIGFGAVALHPSMADLATPIHEQVTELDWQRGLLLTLALLLAPVSLLVQARRGEQLTVEVLAGGAMLLGLLFAARTFALQRMRVSSQVNDRLLRIAAVDLAVTHGRESILQTTIDAANAIGGQHVTTSLYLADGAPGAFICVVGSARRVIRERDLPPATRRILAAGASAWLASDDIASARASLGLDADVTAVAIAPILGEAGLIGLFVSSGIGLTHDSARRHETLATLLALALGRQYIADRLGYEPGRIAHRAQAANGTSFTFVNVDLTDGFANDADSDDGEQTVADALRGAIGEGRLIARYQPRLDLVHGRITGVEMTAAWDSPMVGLVPRGALSAIAAEHGLSQPLRLALLVCACRQAVAWQRQHPDRAIDVIVPLSNAELSTHGLAEDVEIALAGTGCDHVRLVLQLTATTLLEAPGVCIVELADITAIGVQIAINEAGASWSELERLASFPLNMVEIEASLITRIETDERAAAIASHLIAHAHEAGARVVAHGIDRREDWIRLRKLNCDLGQGTLFSAPVTSQELSAMLSRPRQRAPAS